MPPLALTPDLLDAIRDELRQDFPLAEEADLVAPEDLVPERFARWEKDKHPRGQPGNAGQFAPAASGHPYSEGQHVGDQYDSHAEAGKLEEMHTDERSAFDEHHGRLWQAKDRVSGWLNDSPGLEPEKRQAYEQAAHRVLDAMPTGCLKRFLKNTKRVHFHPGLAEVTEAFKAASPDNWPAPSSLIGGFWDATSQEVHLDGDAPLNRGQGARPWAASTTAEIYAHEFTHAIDGPERRELSESDGWKSVWRREIKDSDKAPSLYAKTSSVEGFAEFGRMVFMQPKIAEKHFPDCWYIWKHHGLV